MDECKPLANGSTANLSPESAVELLDRVQYVLDTARGEFKLALKASNVNLTDDMMGKAGV